MDDKHVPLGEIAFCAKAIQVSNLYIVMLASREKVPKEK